MQTGVQLAGVVLNRVGSEGHFQSTAEAIRATTGLPVLGSLPDEAALALPERHLGLVPAAEGGVSASTLNRPADLVAQRFDLAAIRRIAESARPLPQVRSGEVEALPVEVRIGVAQDQPVGLPRLITIGSTKEPTIVLE
jgi:cobyrinic acid a,c-diamide synthase